MNRTFRAELRKIWSVRSTYVIALLVLAVSVALVGFWIFGYKDVENADKTSKALLQMLSVSVMSSTIFLSFIALLSVGHEYRYNTILYSLTSLNSRTKLFIAKWLATVLSALFLSVVATALAAGAFLIGQEISNTNTIAQTMPGWDFAWRAIASIAGNLTFAFLIGMLLRSQVAAIATFLAVPTAVESLMFFVLKDNIKYLPFTALNNLTDNGSGTSHVTSLITVGVYTAVLGAIAYVLFLRRDAN